MPRTGYNSSIDADGSCAHVLNLPPPMDGKIYCPPVKDVIKSLGVRKTMCWNYTEAGRLSRLPCPAFKGFNVDEHAEKKCMLDGTWHVQPKSNASWMNLSPCLTQSKNYFIYVYFTGYSVSILALLISLLIFNSFRQLQCDRVTLHKHLFTCYLLNAVVWITYYGVLGGTTALQENWTFCKVLHLLANYFSCATYMWMFSEGLYLVVILLATFIKDGYRILVICNIIGWGIPLALTIVYGAVRWTIEDPVGCWIDLSTLKYIVQIPIIVSLALNIVFVLMIFILLLTKLTNHVSPDQQQGRKAAKAVLILVPLLGIQYIFTLILPDNPTAALAHKYAVAVMVSFQGLLVAILFCFLNQEVHEACRMHSRRLSYRLHGYGSDVGVLRSRRSATPNPPLTEIPVEAVPCMEPYVNPSEPLKPSAT